MTTEKKKKKETISENEATFKIIQNKLSWLHHKNICVWNDNIICFAYASHLTERGLVQSQSLVD